MNLWTLRRATYALAVLTVAAFIVAAPNGVKGVLLLLLTGFAVAYNVRRRDYAHRAGTDRGHA